MRPANLPLETERLHLSKSGDLDVEFVEGELLDRFEQLALEALEESRKSLTMAMRFLNAALWHLPPERALLPLPLATNGHVLRFNPERVVRRYQAGDGELVRDYLHTVLHCVFHHPFQKRYGEYAAWSLACDVSVELCAIELCGERFPSKRDEERIQVGKSLERVARNTTAPSLYQIFRCGAPGEALYRSYGLSDGDLTELASLFRRDAHDLWATHPQYTDTPLESQGSSQPLPDLQADATGLQRGNSGEGDGTSPATAESSEGGEGTPDGSSSQDADGAQLEPAPEQEAESDELDAAGKEAAAEWERISKRVEAAMRAQRHSLSGEGGMLQNLAVANRKPANYGVFLRRFATMAEDMRVSDEEFDYVYYTYGLQRYGNVPLVEPLEYQESNRVREFVIALDTSGSCSGELIRTFVERTYDILRQQTSFGDRINVHLVQCDNRVRSATKVTSLAQLESYADSFWVSGGGGTDFKPVFEYVDALAESGEFNDLRGLIYFTDGYGAFPTRAPDYEVAFVFVDDESMNVRVPAWAMKVTMTQEEVLSVQA